MHCSSCCSPKGAVSSILRASLGLSLLFVGIAHYRDLPGFLGLVTAGFPEALGSIAMIWGYLYPALLIVGGILLLSGFWMTVAVWCVGLALGSVPAGMLLKSALGTVDLSQTMPAAVNAWVWLIVLFLVVKMSRNCGWNMFKSHDDCHECATGVCSGCGKENCVCPPMPAKKPSTAAATATMMPKIVTPKKKGKK